MTEQLFLDVILIFGLSVAVVYICTKIKVPAIIGFLITGLIVGPNALELVSSQHEVEIFAEIGVVLILFSIGIEFSVSRLMRLKKNILLGGSAQVLGTIALVWLTARAFDLNTEQAVFMGFLTALSSTAIVLKILQGNASVDTPHGKIALSILIFQDIIIVPMMLITPMMAGQSGDIGRDILVLLAKVAALVLFVIVSMRWLMPYLMLQIARTRIRELFLLSILTLCLIVVWFTHAAGLSVALGAFIAGLIISETEFNHQALGDIVPFKEVFASFFFVSVGMLLDINFFISNIVSVLIFTAIVLCIKTGTALVASLLLRYPLRTALTVGFTLFQIGEFSFILSKTGLEFELISDYYYQIFLSVTVLTMVLTPFMIRLTPKLANVKLGRKKLFREKSVADKKDNLIIIGYGINGRNLARAARLFGIEYVIVEMNPDTVRREQQEGENIFYGDAVHEDVLMHAGLKTAKIVVIAISDAEATRRITKAVSELNPGVHIIVRTRYLSEMQALHDAGAHTVIPEEYETSIEIFTHVLNKYMVPYDDIRQFTTNIRANDYSGLRLPATQGAGMDDIAKHLPAADFHRIVLSAESALVGKSPMQVNMRQNYKITLLAIKRDNMTISEDLAGQILEAGDELILFGNAGNIHRIS